MWETLANVPKIPPLQAKQPESINRQLKSFQLEGLNWMIEQEKSQWKGGLLVSFQMPIALNTTVLPNPIALRETKWAWAKLFRPW